MQEDFPTVIAGQITPLIHFIWAGGTKLLSPRSVKVIAEWVRANPDFKVCLWVDSATSGMTFDDLAAEYYSDFQREGIAANNIKIMDVSTQSAIDEFSEYEIKKLRPNFGSSSDLLRYKILHKYGGAYFDSDVRPVEGCKLQDLLRQHPPRAGHQVLFIDHLTQRANSDVTDDDLGASNFIGGKEVGNDSFVCSAENPLMLAIYERTKNNYQNAAQLVKSLEVKDEVDARIILTYGAYTQKRNLTIAMTGPGCVQMELNSHTVVDEDESHITLNVNGSLVEVRKLRNKEYRCTDPLPNTLNWLKVSFAQVRNFEEAVQLVRFVMTFELRKFHVLRLEDHISDVSDMMEELRLSSALIDIPDREKIASEIVNVAEAVLKENDDISEDELYAQCAFVHPEVLDFYRKKELMRATLLWESLEPRKEFVLQIAGGGLLLRNVERSIDLDTFAQDYRPEQCRDVLICIAKGINFINTFLNNKKCCEKMVDKDMKFTGGRNFLGTCETLLQLYAKIYHKIKESRDERIVKTVETYADFFALMPVLLNKVEGHPGFGMNTGSDPESEGEIERTKTFFGRRK